MVPKSFNVLYAVTAIITGYSVFYRLRNFVNDNQKTFASWYRSISRSLAPDYGTMFTLSLVYRIMLHSNPAESTFYRWDIFSSRTTKDLNFIRRELYEVFDSNCMYDLCYSDATYDILMENIDISQGYSRRGTTYIMIGGASVNVYRLFDKCSDYMVTKPWRLLYKKIRDLNV
jgi:hypothetical protein